LYLADESVSLAVHCPNQPLCLAVVSDSLAHLLDPASHRCLADESPTPDRVHQLLLGNHPGSVCDQVGEDVEDLRLDRHAYAATAQLDRAEVQLQVLEGDGHRYTLPAC
jgi:hypothetical protein